VWWRWTGAIDRAASEKWGDSADDDNEYPTPSGSRSDGGDRSGGYGDRGGDRGGDRYSDRGGDRGGDRYSDRGGDRGGDRYGDRGGDRGGDRYGDRGGDRYGDRGGDRGGRYGDRGGDRDSDRGGDRYQREDRTPKEAPQVPPFTAFLGNLSFDATEDEIGNFFSEHCRVKSVRLITDTITQRPKGFGYIEFEDRDSLVTALTADGTVRARTIVTPFLSLSLALSLSLSPSLCATPV